MISLNPRGRSTTPDDESSPLDGVPFISVVNTKPDEVGAPARRRAVTE